MNTLDTRPELGTEPANERANAFAVANWFVRKANENDAVLNQTKLQKLLYYAQGYWMANFDEPLFTKNFHKWQFGPVCVQVYKAFKTQGNGQIQHECDRGKGIELDEEVDNYLEELWAHFGRYSAMKLSAMSHKESPWLDTGLYEVIQPELIKDYFKSLIEGDAATR